MSLASPSKVSNFLPSELTRMAPAGAERMTAKTAVVRTTKPYLLYSTIYAGVISS